MFLEVGGKSEVMQHLDIRRGDFGMAKHTYENLLSRELREKEDEEQQKCQSMHINRHYHEGTSSSLSGHILYQQNNRRHALYLLQKRRRYLCGDKQEYSPYSRALLVS